MKFSIVSHVAKQEKKSQESIVTLHELLKNNSIVSIDPTDSSIHNSSRLDRGKRTRCTQRISETFQIEIWSFIAS